LRKTYRRDNFKELSRQIIIIGFILIISVILGTLINFVFLEVTIDAAIIGREAFLEPFILTVPLIFEG
jgi:hypothetical protein